MSDQISYNLYAALLCASWLFQFGCKQSKRVWLMRVIWLGNDDCIALIQTHWLLADLSPWRCSVKRILGAHRGTDENRRACFHHLEQKGHSGSQPNESVYQLLFWPAARCDVAVWFVIHVCPTSKINITGILLSECVVFSSWSYTLFRLFFKHWFMVVFSYLIFSFVSWFNLYCFSGKFVWF